MEDRDVPNRPVRQVVVGGMNTDADPEDLGGTSIPAREEEFAAHEERTIGGQGSIGVGEGLDDRGTHGGGTLTLPDDDEVVPED